jgi:hypothetical protein
MPGSNKKRSSSRTTPRASCSRFASIVILDRSHTAWEWSAGVKLRERGTFVAIHRVQAPSHENELRDHLSDEAII